MRTPLPERARVVIAVGPPLFRAGLRSVLESEWRFCTVTETSTASEAIDRVVMLRPELLVLDAAIPDFPEPAVLRALASSVPVVVLVNDAECPDRTRIRRLGVFALVDKQLDAAGFLQAIRSALSAGLVPRAAGRRALLHRPVAAGPPRISTLTSRERQVLVEVAAAYSNKEIARRLAISEETVKRHVSAIFTKLGVSSRVELTLLATRCALVGDLYPSARTVRHVQPAVAV